MAKRQEFSVRGGCAGIRLARIAGSGLVIATGSMALADPITDAGFFGPQDTLIDFETNGMGSDVDLIQGDTLTLPAAEYSPLGVQFDKDIFWANDGNTLLDAAQTLGASPTISIPSAAISTFDLLFTTPVDAFGFFVADNISAGGARSGVTFEAYDAGDQLLDMQSFGGPFIDDTLMNAQGAVAYGFMGIVRSDEQNPISRVTVTKGAAILDDLRFRPIPSPGAIGVLGIAGIMTGIRRRR